MPKEKTYPKTGRARARLFEQIIEAGRAGKSHAQMAECIGISRDTLQNWLTAYADFAGAVKKADDYALAWWEALGQRHAETREGNASMIIFVMKNRFGQDYGEGAGVLDDDITGPSNFQSMTKLSPKARKKLRKVLQAELPQSGEKRTALAEAK